MAVGAVGKPNISFEDWLKAENKEGQVRRAPQLRPGALTENGVPVHLAQELHNGKGVFQVAAQNPTKESAGAGSVSSTGVHTQHNSVDTGGAKGVDNAVNSGDNNTVLAAGATGHTAQSQAPTLASGLQASQGNENTGSQGGATSDSKQLNQNLYAQYEAAMREAKLADSGEKVSTGEGTLSTGAAEGSEGTEGAGKAEGANGTESTTGANPDVTNSPTDSTNPNDSANTGPENTANKDNQNDSANNGSDQINRQEQRRQEEILDAKRFHKLNDDEAA